MVHQVEYNGEIHEFPDEATPEMISRALGLNGNVHKNVEPKKIEQEKKPIIDDELKRLTVGTSPFEQIKSGLLGLGKAGENIAKTFTGGYAPSAIDDVAKMTGGSKSPLAEKIGQYALSVAATPQGLLAQMLAAGGYQATQNPEDKLKGFLEGAVVPPALKGIGKTLGGLKNIIGGAFKNLSPQEKSVAEALQKSEKATEEAISPKPGLYEHPKTEIQNIENEIGKHINVEGEHGVRAASGITNRVNSIEKFWGDNYKNFIQKVRDVKFQMPKENMENLSYDKNEIMKKLQEGVDPKKVVSEIQKEKDLSENNPFYKHLLSKAPTSEDTSAADFIAKHKDFRDTMFYLKQDLKSKQFSAVEKDKISEAIDKGKEMESQIKKTLNEGLGEFKPEFDWINKGYSEHIFPLRSNPVVKQAKKGKMSEDILKSLRTKEPGMDILRDIVKQDPELLRNVIGQKYLKKPSSIYSPNELTREFLDEMPEFKNLLGQREKTLERLTKEKDISLKEHVKAQKELDRIKKSKKKSQRQLLIGGSLLGVPPTYKYLYKLLTGSEHQG